MVALAIEVNRGLEFELNDYCLFHEAVNSWYRRFHFILDGFTRLVGVVSCLLLLDLILLSQVVVTALDLDFVDTAPYVQAVLCVVLRDLLQDFLLVNMVMDVVVKVINQSRGYIYGLSDLVKLGKGLIYLTPLEASELIFKLHLFNNLLILLLLRQ